MRTLLPNQPAGYAQQVPSVVAVLANDRPGLRESDPGGPSQVLDFIGDPGFEGRFRVVHRIGFCGHLRLHLGEPSDASDEVGARRIMKRPLITPLMGFQMQAALVSCAARPHP